MCGRFTLTKNKQEIIDDFPLFDVSELEPHYNIAPTQKVAAARVLPDMSRGEIVPLHWGLIPSWAEDPRIGNAMINARAETAAGKPAFRSAYRKRRCLILADGFYEWQKTEGKKQPYYFRVNEGRTFAFAGLWEHWQKEDRNIDSCTILTTQANELLKAYHDRMPVILPPKDYERWLDPKNLTAAGLETLLVPFPASEMTAYPVSTLVNNPRNDKPDCILPL